MMEIQKKLKTILEFSARTPYSLIIEGTQRNKGEFHIKKMLGYRNNYFRYVPKVLIRVRHLP